MDSEMSKFYEECEAEKEIPTDDENAGVEENLSTQVESPRDDDKSTESKDDDKEAKVEKEEKNDSKSNSENLQEHTRYEGDQCIYTDPHNKQEYVWSNDMKQWVPKGYNPVFDGRNYTYIDAKGIVHKWNQETSKWEVDDQISKDIPQDAFYGFDGENHTYTDPNDKSVYIWDREKNAWFPKVDDDFMARYQMSYGFVDNTSKVEEPEVVEKSDNKRKAPAPPTWFDLDDQHNTKVYVSNLPLDITEQDFVDFMQKCGLILKDSKTNKFKIKLYTEPDGSLKGDALCDYIKVESVDLALKVLDGADLRGKRVKVQRAKFQMKGDYNPSLKPKKKKKNEKEKERKMQQKLLDWRPDKLRGEREKFEKTVVIRNLFTPATFDENVELILEYTEDIRTEASKCGTVRKVTLYDKHPEGVATVTFSDAEEADICVKFFNNRWFGQRKIVAETWDGKTKYKILENEAETKERMEKWAKFLEQEERVKKS